MNGQNDRDHITRQQAIDPGRPRDEALEERLAQVQRKVLRRGVRLDPPRSEREVADFGARIGVRLPEEYRRFLLEVGDGPREEKVYGRQLTPEELETLGTHRDRLAYAVEPWHDRERRRREGPPFYGLQPLERTVADSGRHSFRPWLPFPLTDEWIWEDEREDEAGPDRARLEAVCYHGHLYLGTDGCGEDWLLVVTGPERGRIWNRADDGAIPCDPPADFLAWYERWLDGDPY
jgi:hypothetical protein